MADGSMRLLHFARLENPGHALRAACGAWRDPSNWTTERTRVTCPECLRRIEASAPPSPPRAPTPTPTER